MTILIFLIFLNLFAMSFKDKLNISGMQALFFAFFSCNMVVYLGGAVNLLKPVTALVYIIMLACFIVFVIKNKPSADTVKGYFDISVILVNLSAVVFTIIYQIINPLLYYWDEYSFWGVSVKLTKYYDMFHSVMHTMVGMLSSPPANMSMYYLSDFFARDFLDARLLLSYTVMFLICFGIMADCVQKKTDNQILTTGFFIFLILSPFMAIYHLPNPQYSSLSYAYGTTMVDFNIAVIFGGVVAAYLSEKEKPLFAPAVMFLALVKNTSIFFAVLAALVICCFELFDSKKKLGKKVIAIILTMALPLASYASWALHTSVYSNYSYAPIEYDLTEEIPAEYQEEEKSGIARSKEDSSILSIINPSIRTERHSQVVSQLFGYLKTQHVTTYGKDTVLITALLMLGLISAFLTKEDKMGTLIAVIGMFVGIFAYMLIISYFISFFGDGMVEYPRYMSSYYWSFIYMVSVIFACAAGKKSKIISQAILCALLLSNTKSVMDMGLDKTVIDPPENPYLSAMDADEKLAPYREYLTKGTNLYLVLPDMDTWGYYLYQRRALPAISNVGRGLPDANFTITFREHYDYENKLFHYLIAKPELFSQLMNRYFDYILVIEPDEEFVESYGDLFEDGIKEGVLYRITEDEIPMKVVNANG